MPRTCTVCSAESRRQIDTAIVFGKSNRSIAKQFGVTDAAVQRHKKHVAAALDRAAEKRELSIGESILDRLEELYQLGLGLLTSAERAKNHSACVGYLREIRGILGGLYEVSKSVAPAYADEPRMLPEKYIEAISIALGYTGVLVPRVENPPLTSLPVLPDDSDPRVKAYYSTPSGHVIDPEILP